MSAFPSAAADMNTQNLTALLQTLHPQITVNKIRVAKELSFGDGEEPVSTAGRVEAELTYGGIFPADLPKDIIIKVCRPDMAGIPLYQNEVEFYTRIRSQLALEAPLCLGGYFDKESGTFGLALEDMRQRGVSFPNVTTQHGSEHVKAVITELAKLHANFWNSDRFNKDLDWVDSHTHGAVYQMFNHPDIVPTVISNEVANQQFKKELLQAVSQTTEGLYQEMRAVQQHQATLDTTLCHGDTHIGNTYTLPDGTAGLYDWQLMARGHGMHDVSYVIITGLTVEERRLHEKALIKYYLEQLRINAVSKPPSFDQAYREHRHAAVWCLYIGWLTTPIENYGWDITVCNIIRLTTAYNDLNSNKAVAELPPAKAFI